MKKVKLSNDWKLIIILAFFKLTIHFLTNTNYEFQRDAFLYLALSDHLDFGYLSVPPLIAVFAKTTRFLFGDSLFSIRLFPALIGAVSVVIIGLIVKTLGGKKWAIWLACTAFIVSPAFLRCNTLFQPVSFNQFFWLLSGYFMVKLIQTKDPKFWLHLSIVWGLGFLNKYSIVFLVLGFCVSLLLTPDRKIFVSKYFSLGLLLGFFIILPNLIWQMTHNWPVIIHMKELQETQLIHVRIVDFLVAQLLMNLPGTFIWVFGLIFFLRFKEGENFRVLAYTYFAVILILILLQGKHYYTLGLYPLLFAAGGFGVEKYFAGRRRFLRQTVFNMILIAIPIIPFSLPVLPLEKMIQYGGLFKKFGVSEPLRWEDGRIHSLPQDYADMVGWKELSEIVINTYNSLSETEKKRCYIFTNNYGQAGAIKYYGKGHNLPEPVCFNGSFLFWAPDSVNNINTLINIDDDTEDVSHYFAEVKQVGQITNVHARESGLSVFLCKNPRNGFEDSYQNSITTLKNRYRYH